jgi:hypothetical protein
MLVAIGRGRSLGRSQGRDYKSSTVEGRGGKARWLIRTIPHKGFRFVGEVEEAGSQCERDDFGDYSLALGE